MSLKNIELCKGVDLKKYSRFKIGGVADYFFKINTYRDIAEIIKDFGRSFHILGNGSNILIQDTKIKIPVVRLSSKFDYISQTGSGIEIGAATLFSKLIRYCLLNNIEGFSPLAGIPATLGGMLRMNAAANGMSISENLISLEVINEKGELDLITRDNMRFGYRDSFLKNMVITKAVFSYKSPSLIKKDVNYYLKKRLAAQDFTAPSCGCVFKNPSGFSAGLLIDSCGLKGLRKGGAIISPKHANFILNTGGASYQDVDYLIRVIRDKVFAKHNIVLEEEIQRWLSN
jgi:UDP-N-acetylmuramate dehydrogenase